LIDWIGELLNNTLLLIFIIILVGSFIYVTLNSIKKKLSILKENRTNKKECEKAKRLDIKRRYTDYFWAQPMWFIIISLAFFMLYTISLFIYDATGVWLFVLIFALYLVFVLNAILSYINFPKIAAERFNEHKQAIINSICNDLNSHRDRVNEFLAKYHLDTDARSSKEDCIDNMIIHPTGVSKFDFPPYLKFDAPKKNVIAKSTLQVIVLERDFMFVCPNTTEFDLLHPKRGDLKKKCAYTRAAGECEDIFYSLIKYIAYEDEAIKLYFWNDIEEPKIIAKVAKKEDAKPTIARIREKIRLVERQRLNKIAEVLHFERLKDKNLKVEVVNEVKINNNETNDNINENEENQNQEEAQVEAQEENSNSVSEDKKEG